MNPEMKISGANKTPRDNAMLQTHLMRSNEVKKKQRSCYVSGNQSNLFRLGQKGSERSPKVANNDRDNLHSRQLLLYLPFV